MLLVERGGFRQCGTYNESAKIRRKAIFVLFCLVREEQKGKNSNNCRVVTTIVYDS